MTNIDRELPERSPISVGGVDEIWPWVLGAAVICWMIIVFLENHQHTQHSNLALSFGLIAVWRYCWGGFHFIRALIFLRIVFPRKRRQLSKSTSAIRIDHIYGLICSFGIPEPQFRSVYRALMQNCISSGVPATLVASVTSDRDCAILAELLEEMGQPETLRVIVQFQEGEGKRKAMGMALRAIAREQPSSSSVTLFLDGDVMLSPNALAECISFMATDSSLAALTTNNDAEVSAGGLARQWYRLRFAQRHLMMSSLALSGRLLVLTGRFSLYRTAHVVEPAFIRIVESDCIEHWLHGRINLLSGDDKSAWHRILQGGGRMTYLPHVKAISFEEISFGRGFVASSTPLMMRWFGNMFRANGRALRLGPARCGMFLWWCLVDQRISPWTTQLGFAIGIALMLRGHLEFFFLCVAWILLSRTAMAAAYGALSGRFHPAWPALLCYTQIWGSALKIFLQFHPYLQSWTRQRITRNESVLSAHLAATSLHVSSMLFLAITAASIANLIVGS